MDWVALITVVLPVVLKLLEDCNKQDGEQVVRNRLKNPGVAERWALRLALSRQGLRGAELRDAVQAGMDWLRTADDDDIATLLADAKSGK